MKRAMGLGTLIGAVLLVGCGKTLGEDAIGGSVDELGRVAGTTSYCEEDDAGFGRGPILERCVRIFLMTPLAEEDEVEAYLTGLGWPEPRPAEEPERDPNAGLLTDDDGNLVLDPDGNPILDLSDLPNPNDELVPILPQLTQGNSRCRTTGNIRQCVHYGYGSLNVPGYLLVVQIEDLLDN